MKAPRGTPPDVTHGAGARHEGQGTPPAPPSDTLPNWYAIWVMSNAEFVVEDALLNLDIEPFLPTWIETVQWSDRKKEITRPLFRGYLFARCADRRVPEIAQIAGVIKVLPDNLTPAPVDKAELENVRRLLHSGLAMKVCDYVQGDAVEIERGPLAGVKGIVQRTKQGTRVIVKIEILRRAVSVTIDAEDLVKESKAA
ncbi:MAG: UpxY family transcription antiterminator [Pseudomonadota bacterium]